jgi:serine/threonine-protein kinase
MRSSTPSKKLVALLHQLGLCGPSDFRRCRRHVAQLSRDLPPFDSVWIDSLLQLGRLSPYQARIIEAGQGESLRVGPCLLIEPLGHGRNAQTFLARHVEGRERCVLKVLGSQDEPMGGMVSDVKVTCSRLGRETNRKVVGPHAVQERDGQVVLVSRYIEGPHLGELMIRRGRFPADVVTEIACQVIQALAFLQASKVVHGDLCLRNIRLTSDGTVVLVDAGIEPDTTREVTFQPGMPPERYDGIAPERIGTGAAATLATDLYGLGYLLWMLLAGRSPFPTGDPLAKLAAQQTKSVDDVREWAPETPDDLAILVTALTDHEPSRRVAAFKHWQTVASRQGGRGRSRLRQLLASAGTVAPRLPTASSGSFPGRWTIVTTLLFVLSGASLSLMERGARTELLDMAAGVSSDISQTAASWFGRSKSKDVPSADDPTASPDLLPLPAPDAQGVIRLTGTGPYDVAQVNAVGHLTILGDVKRLPEIVVRDQPLTLQAARVTLRNVRIRFAAKETSPRVGSLLQVQSHEFAAVGCLFSDQTAIAPSERSKETASSAFIAWQPIDPDGSVADAIVLRDNVFRGRHDTLSLQQPPGRVTITNCLHLGSRSVVALSDRENISRPLHIDCDGLTLREAESLIRMPESIRHSGTESILIEAHSCVFDLAGERSALFVVVGADLNAFDSTVVALTGDGTLAGADLVIARQVASPSRRTILLESGFTVEGIVVEPFKFAGPADGRTENSSLDTYNGPRRGGRLPGVDASRLSSWRPSQVGSALRTASER